MHQNLGLLCPVVAAAQNALAVVADEELVEVVVAGVVPRPQVETGDVIQLCREISRQPSLQEPYIEVSQYLRGYKGQSS